MSDLLCCCCCVALLCCVGALLLALFVCLFVDKSNQRVRPARQECLFVCLYVRVTVCVCLVCVVWVCMGAWVRAKNIGCLHTSVCAAKDG